MHVGVRISRVARDGSREDGVDATTGVDHAAGDPVIGLEWRKVDGVPKSVECRRRSVEQGEEPQSVAGRDDESAARIAQRGDVGGDGGIVLHCLGLEVRERQGRAHAGRRIDGGPGGLVVGRACVGVVDQGRGQSSSVVQAEIATIVPGAARARIVCEESAPGVEGGVVEVGGHAAVGGRLVGLVDPMNGDGPLPGTVGEGGLGANGIVGAQDRVDETVRRDHSAGILEGRLGGDDQGASEEGIGPDRRG